MEDLITYLKSVWKNYVIIILLILLLFVAVSFQGMFTSYSFAARSTNDMAYQSKSTMVDSSGYYAGSSFAPLEVERKIIYNANINLKSDNYDYSKTQIDASVKAHSVLLLNQYENEYRDNYKTISYSFKVPSDKFDMFVLELKNYGEVENYNIYSNDATGVYTDYSDRVERYNEQMLKYRLMLAKTNLTIDEEIKINQRIDTIEDSMFFFNTQLANIDQKVEYSQVSLTLREKPSVWSEIDFLGFKDGLKMFVKSLEAGIQFILYVLGFIVPFLFIYGISKFVKRFKR